MVLVGSVVSCGWVCILGLVVMGVSVWYCTDGSTVYTYVEEWW